MMGRFSLLTASMLALVVASQASAQDVVMRRPLGSGVSSTGTTAPTPTPTPDGGLTTRPDLDPIVDPPTGSGFGFASWVVGDWSGQETCGQQTTLTRSVQCIYTYVDFSHGFSTTTYHVADSQCASQGPKEPNTYTGTGAGCGYHLVTTGVGPWLGGTEFDGTPIDPVCSADAHRDKIYECHDQDDAVVAMTYCTEGLSADGTTGLPDDATEYGNFDGCTYKWKMEQSQVEGRDFSTNNTTVGYAGGFDYYCGQPGDTAGTSGVPGPVLFVNESAYCARSDGTPVDDQNCDPGTKPSPGMKVAGSCHPAFIESDAQEGTTKVCFEDGGQVVLKALMLSDPQGEGHMCDSAIGQGATCCMVRVPTAKVGDESFYQVVATKGSPQLTDSQSYYPDYQDGGAAYTGLGSFSPGYNPDTCTPTNPDGDVILSLQPGACF